MNLLLIYVLSYMHIVPLSRNKQLFPHQYIILLLYFQKKLVIIKVGTASLYDVNNFFVKQYMLLSCPIILLENLFLLIPVP